MEKQTQAQAPKQEEAKTQAQAPKFSTFKADIETNFSTKKASVIFRSQLYTARNKAEQELLEEKAKNGLCFKVD